jgi:hypothetical protein
MVVGFGQGTTASAAWKNERRHQSEQNRAYLIDLKGTAQPPLQLVDGLQLEELHPPVA